MQTDYHHSSGSIPIMLKYVALIRAVNRFWSASLLVTELLYSGLPFLCTPSVIQKESRSRQTRHTHIHTHQITQCDWSQTVCLSPIVVLSQLSLFLTFAVFQDSPYSSLSTKLSMFSCFIFLFFILTHIYSYFKNGWWLCC